MHVDQTYTDNIRLVKQKAGQGDVEYQFYVRYDNDKRPNERKIVPLRKQGKSC